MTEREYIDVSNLQRLRMAAEILRHVIDTGMDEEIAKARRIINTACDKHYARVDGKVK